MFRFRAFGGAALEGPDGPVAGRATQRHRLALLALLSVARDRGMTRERIIALLWPDASPDKGRRLLSDSIYRINQAVGGDGLVAVGDEVRIDPARIGSDVRDFVRAIETGDWERAVALQEAPLLDGFFLPGAGDFERWVDEERQRLARERSRALETLASAVENEDPAAACRWWRMLAAADPYSSRVALRLMRCLDRAGDPAGAVQHARIHTTLVRDDLGLEPDPEVPGYVEELRARTPVRPDPPSRIGAVGEAASIGPGPRAGDADAPGQTGRVAHAPVASETAPAPAAGGPGSPPPVGEGSDDPRPASPPATPADRSAADPSDGEAAATFALGGGARRPRRHRWLFGGVIVLGAAAAAIAVVRPRSPTPAPSASDVTSLVVLPFADLSPGGGEEFLGDGLAEELLTRLSNTPGLRVIGRTSAFAFKGRSLGAREIGASLGVGAVLDGSVRRSGDRLRITAQLVDAGSGFELWAESYERRASDVFTIQDDIANAIVTRLLGGGSAPRAAAGNPVQDPEAYNLYLHGRFEWHKRTEAGLLAARDYFQEAVERAPLYARAHVGLGDAYAVLGFYDYLPPGEAFPRAAEAARRAIELDPTLAEPHATLGYVALYHDWDGPSAEASFRRAIELAPGYSTGHQWYANLLTAQGRFDEAVREMRAATELDPLSLIANSALGWVHYYQGEWEAALSQLDHARRLDPGFELAYLWAGLVLEAMGRSEESLAELRTAVGFAGTAIARAALARGLAIAGEGAEAGRMLARLEAEADDGYAPSFEIAKVHVALGDADSALRWLDRAYDERSHSMVFLAVDPQLAPLHGRREFRELVAKVGMTESLPRG